MSDTQPGARATKASVLHIATNVEVSRVERALAQFGDASRPTTIKVEAVDARNLNVRLGDKDRPIDALIVEGVSYLEDAFDAGLIVKFESAAMHQAIPYVLRSRARGWFAVSYVVQAVVSSSGARLPSTLTDVWSLAHAERTSIPCLFPAGSVRSRTTLAEAMRNLGARAESVIAQWVPAANAYAPRSELDLIRAVAAGRCTVGMAYSDAIAEAKLSAPKPRFDVSWPKGKGEGAPVLATGIAMTTRLENYDRVLRLLEWVGSDNGQRAWTDSTLSFPASQFARSPASVLTLGSPPPDLNSINMPSALLTEAEKLAVRIGYR